MSVHVNLRLRLTQLLRTKLQKINTWTCAREPIRPFHFLSFQQEFFSINISFFLSWVRQQQVVESC